MLVLTRRSLLALGALGGAQLVLCGCTDDGGSPDQERKKADADLPLRTRAVAATDQLLAGYDAVLAGPGAAQADRLRALRAEVTEHRAALATGLPAASATASASATAAGAPVTTAAQLAAAERTTAGARLADLSAASPELAKLLAVVSAAGALHAAALGDTAPVTAPAAAVPTPTASTPAASGSAASTPAASGSTASGSAPAKTPLPAAEATALQTALAAEHAAVYGYGVVGARQPVGPQRTDAQTSYLAHQAARDAWQRLLNSGGATPTAAAPGYQLPFPVADAAGAKQLAAHIEVQLTGVYAALVAATSGELRQRAAAALREAALAARHWGADQTALPGLPAAGGATPSPSASA
ncbi:ferritin-like domain-containing protein [Kitasatospora sp. NPDC002040]|uniref:ferritin-like domain-containing protein n=1 Tax=Kitasatospora sp. NPDC002040 TaxID=3154661 RepID=UPI00331776B0